MSYSNPHLAERMVQLKREQALREAEAHRLAREARAGRRSWLSDVWLKVVSAAGQGLEAMGRSVEGLGLRLQGCPPSPRRGLVHQE